MNKKEDVDLCGHDLRGCAACRNSSNLYARRDEKLYWVRIQPTLRPFPPPSDTNGMSQDGFPVYGQLGPVGTEMKVG